MSWIGRSLLVLLVFLVLGWFLVSLRFLGVLDLVIHAIMLGMILEAPLALFLCTIITIILFNPLFHVMSMGVKIEGKG